MGVSIPDEAWAAIAVATGLSRREIEVLQCVVEDQQDKEIADTLGISKYTVRTHMKRIRAKLGAGSRVKLVGRVFAEYSAWGSTHPS